MRFKPAHLFIFLSIIFLLYSFSIYLKPFRVGENMTFNIKKASHGRIVWQKYNCQSCHQLYGLGGYLGPDLTNIYSDPKKGRLVIPEMIKYGVKQMPGFKLSDIEMEDLLEFLKSTDASGKADPRNFNIENTGMIEPNEKK